MSLVVAQSKFLQDTAKLFQYAASLGFTLTYGETYRSPEQQAIYVRTGRSRTYRSLHIQRLAIDLNIFKGGVLCANKATLAPLGAYWESLDPLNSWGGNGSRFVDLPHFSRGIDRPEWARVT
jgi:hypothetical protein